MNYKILTQSSEFLDSRMRRYTDEKIDPFRNVGDNLGDSTLNVLRALNYVNGDGDPLDFITEQLNRASLNDDQSKTLNGFINHVNTIPSWVDFERIENGRHFSQCIR